MSDDENDEKFVKNIGCDVFFYSDVNTTSVSKLNRILKRLEQKLLKRSVELSGYNPEITVYINSGGGDIFAGFSGMDHISNCKLHVTTVADGCCASAATFLFLAGDTRVVNKHSYILIHQLSMDLWGKYDDIKQEAENADKFMETIRGIYREKTKIPKKKLDDLMKRDVYLNCEDCKKFGVV